MEHEIETGQVERMASEGQGIVLHNGRVTFIPFTTVGDTVRYKIDHHKKNYATATLLEVVHPSTNRVKPLCRYFGKCGGCQLQHVNYAAQLEYKRKWVKDALRKIGGLNEISVSPVIPSSIEWAYRRRISLQLAPYQTGYRAGYIGIDNTSLLEVESCPIFTSISDPIVAEVHALAAKLHPACDEHGKATILKCEEGKYLLHFHFKTLPKNSDEILGKAMNESADFRGIVASSQKKQLTYGTIETHAIIDDLHISFSPKTFIQNHPEQSLNIYRMIEEYAKETRPKTTLDLYCGIGVTSLLIARHGGSVKGIEINPQAVAFAKTNALNNKINNAAFDAAPTENILPSILKKGTPDLIIVNPPREGIAAHALKLLCSSRSRSLIYISCMPSTLARDLKPLCQAGYKVKSVIPFDMFPQTIHVETVVILEL